MSGVNGVLVPAYEWGALWDGLKKEVGEIGATCYNFQLKSLFVRYIISVNVYIKLIIRVNKMYHTIDISYCNQIDI